MLLGNLEAESDKFDLTRNKITVFPTSKELAELQAYRNKEIKKMASSISQPKGDDIELKNVKYRPHDNRYIGRKMIHGLTITVYGKTQKECADNLKARIESMYLLKDEKPAKNQYLFKDMFMRWYKQEKEPFLQDNSKDDILRVYKELELFHNKNIKSITKQEIIAYLQKLQDNRGKEKIRLYLNACLKYYLNEGILKVNPCANVKVKKSYARKSAFTYEQQEQILTKLEGNPLKIIVLIYLITGLRRREFDFKHIEEHIDFENRILKAENLKGRNLVKRYKYIQLSKEALSLIMNNIDIIHKYNDETAYREFFEFLSKHHIPGSIVTCRHTFATNCFYLGKPELVISREMGHSTSLLTKDVYTDIDYHLSAEKIHKIYNNLYNE